jgi:oxygen-independent coproporphyrinogen-3 oxidase
MNDEERLIREMILQLKLGGLDLDYFRQKFKTDIRARFSPALEKLRAAADLDVTEDRVRVTRQGLLRIDELLHEFYLPQHQAARYT